MKKIFSYMLMTVLSRTNVIEGTVGELPLRLKPQWKSGGDLSQLKPKAVKLRFTLQNAKLYSFSFKSERR